MSLAAKLAVNGQRSLLIPKALLRQGSPLSFKKPSLPGFTLWWQASKAPIYEEFSNPNVRYVPLDNRSSVAIQCTTSFSLPMTLA